ncbi:hypothetical protein ACEN2J_02375 [Pseudorhodobacter sp. W20_MBD10_FR17]|uniref:hypothetical protein n=1 Tax=Pseudorhodobacter sp. W20_MBD10_FR17 TaxID=3240266 RepID=UPI003F9B1073
MGLVLPHGGLDKVWGAMVNVAYEVEPLGEKAGECACCGRVTRAIWGIVHVEGAETVASYFVNWTVGADLADHPANMDLIIGAWGEGTGASDRVAVSLLYTVGETGPAVMVIDAAGRNIAKNPLVGAALGRDEVLGTSVATLAFGLFDAVVSQDARFQP